MDNLNIAVKMEQISVVHEHEYYVSMFLAFLKVS